MKKKGFTLIELLVVIAIIAMLLAILMPALNKVKRLAQRLICGTNVKGLGTAMGVYANDYEDDYPVQNPTGSHWWSPNGNTNNWFNPDKDWSIDKGVNVSASLYLLVRNADVDPKSFICRSSDQTPFKGIAGDIDLVELWDFGGRDVANAYSDGLPREHQSYAFQLPYAVGQRPARPASSTSGASMAILADKNPWCDPKLDMTDLGTENDAKKKDYTTLVDYLGINASYWTATPVPEWLQNSTSDWRIQIANSQPHGREGQNVLFGDGHASFEKRSDVSYQHDNIYTMWNEDLTSEAKKRMGRNRPVGQPDPLVSDSTSAHSFSVTDEDSLLVNDDSRYPNDHEDFVTN
jgi:prepilin-type N-terminal cleavage/methylation domain-containing protein/prepilin-type processing-associated H-X9-DG protein